MEAVKILRNDESLKRWHSTGFMSGGVESVDAEQHTLKSAQVVRPGEALGHGFWIDREFCASVAAMGNAGKRGGLKARFGHPNMCSEALGTFLGRWKSFGLDDAGRVVADLHLSSTAAESPKGDLRNYIEQLAAKEPQHFGASIVFTVDKDAMFQHAIANGAKEVTDEYGSYLDLTDYKSPDPDNVKNLPHARCAELHAADLVDDPAATDGMFSGAGGLSLAAEMTEWLDTHPEIIRTLAAEPKMIDVVSRYADQLKPFLARYTANFLKPSAVAESPAEPAQESKPAESGTDYKALAESLTAQINEHRERLNALAVERDGALTRAVAAETSIVTMKADGEKLAGELTAAKAELAIAASERDEAKRRLSAIESGQPPVSSSPAQETPKLTPMEKARKSARI